MFFFSTTTLKNSWKYCRLFVSEWEHFMYIHISESKIFSNIYQIPIKYWLSSSFPFPTTTLRERIERNVYTYIFIYSFSFFLFFSSSQDVKPPYKFVIQWKEGKKKLLMKWNVSQLKVSTKEYILLSEYKKY